MNQVASVKTNLPISSISTATDLYNGRKPNFFPTEKKYFYFASATASKLENKPKQSKQLIDFLLTMQVVTLHSF